MPSDSRFNPFLYAPAEVSFVSIILERSRVGVDNVCSADANGLEMRLLGRNWDEPGQLGSLICTIYADDGDICNIGMLEHHTF